MPNPEEISLRVAMKAAIFNEKNQLLILQVSKNHYNESARGKWDLPGGKIKPDESFMDGFRREVLEETGVKDFETVKPFAVDEWWPMIKGTKTHIIATFFICKVKSGRGVSLTVNEHDSYAWISADDIDSFDFYVQEKEVARAAFKEITS